MTEDNGSEDFVRMFVGDTEGPSEYVGFFEDTGETGDFYVSDKHKDEIVAHVQVYADPSPLQFSESDVRMVWSNDMTRCGLIIRHEMKAIIDVQTGQTIVAQRGERSITDKKWLVGF